MHGNSTGWPNAKLSELVDVLWAHCLLQQTPSQARNGSSRLCRDCAASLQDSSLALHALPINLMHWPSVKKSLCAISFGRRARDTRQREHKHWHWVGAHDALTRRHGGGPKCQAAGAFARCGVLRSSVHSRARSPRVGHVSFSPSFFSSFSSSCSSSFSLFLRFPP